MPRPVAEEAVTGTPILLRVSRVRGLTVPAHGPHRAVVLCVLFHGRPSRQRVTSPAMWRSLWESSPPVIERSLCDDVKAACCVLLGAAQGVLILDPGHPRHLVIAAVGLALVTTAINVMRRFGPRSDGGAGQPNPGAGVAPAARDGDG